MKKNFKNKGFTLIEMLIVIVVIGVLAAVMMLSSKEAVTSAKATQIISNLYSFKDAISKWYVDNIDRVDGLGRIRQNNETGKYTGEFAESGRNIKTRAKDLFEYISGGDLQLVDEEVKDSYGGKYITDWISASGETDKDEPRKWVITYIMPTDDKALKRKFESRAQSAGLIYKKIKVHGAEPYTAARVGKENEVALVAIDFEAKQ